jgi:hypothetical protein
MTKTYPLTIKDFIDQTSFAQKERFQAQERSTSTLKHIENSIIALSVLSTLAFIAPFIAGHFIKLHNGIKFGVGLGVPLALGATSFGLGFLSVQPKHRIEKALLLQQAEDLQKRRRNTHTYTPLSDVRRLDEERPFTTEEMLRPKTKVDRRLYTDAAKDPDKEKEIPLRGIQNALDILGVDAPSPYSYVSSGHEDIRTLAKKRHKALYAHLALRPLPKTLDDEVSKKLHAQLWALCGPLFNRLHEVTEDEEKFEAILNDSKKSEKLYFELRNSLMDFCDLIGQLTGDGKTQRVLFKKSEQAVRSCAHYPFLIDRLFDVFKLLEEEIKTLDIFKNEGGSQKVLALLEPMRAYVYFHVTSEADATELIDIFPKNLYLVRSQHQNQARTLIKKLEAKIKHYPFLKKEIDEGKKKIEQSAALFLATDSPTKCDWQLEVWIAHARRLLIQIKTVDISKLVAPIQTRKEWDKVAPHDVKVPLNRGIAAKERNPLEYVRDQISSKKAEAERCLEELNALLKGVELPEDEEWSTAAMRTIITLEKFVKTEPFEIPKKPPFAEMLKLYHHHQTILYRDISPALIAARRMLHLDSDLRLEVKFLTPEGVQAHFQNELDDIESEAKLKFLDHFHKNFNLSEWQSFATKMAGHAGEALWFGQGSHEGARAFFEKQTSCSFFVFKFSERLKPLFNTLPLPLFEEKLPEGYDEKFLTKWAKTLEVETPALSAIFTKLRELKPQTHPEYSQTIHYKIAKPILAHYMEKQHLPSFAGIDTTIVGDSSPRGFLKTRRNASMRVLKSSEQLYKMQTYPMMILGLFAFGTAMAAILVKDRIAGLVCQMGVPVSVLAMMVYSHILVKKERQLYQQRLALQNLETGKLGSRDLDPKFEALDLANASVHEAPSFDFKCPKRAGQYQKPGFKTNRDLTIQEQAERLALNLDPDSGEALRDELGIPLGPRKLDESFYKAYRESENHNLDIEQELKRHNAAPKRQAV